MWGQGRCERRSDVFVKIQKKNHSVFLFSFFFGGGGVGLGGQDGCEPRSEVFEGVRPGGQGGCERRIEVFVKIQKKKLGGGHLGGGGGLVGGRGFRVDVNAMLGVMWSMGDGTKKYTLLS